MYYDVFEMLARKKGLSPTAAAEQNGISRATVSAWRNKNYRPKAETLTRLAEFFGVSERYLLGSDLQALADLMEYQIARGEKLLERETNPNKRIFLEKEIAENKEALKDVRANMKIEPDPVKPEVFDNVEKEKATDELKFDDGDVDADHLRFALYEGGKDLTREQIEEVLGFVKYVRQRDEYKKAKENRSDAD